jgi:multidrug efflux pump subunit AcrA (membrane-fusion protein)
VSIQTRDADASATQTRTHHTPIGPPRRTAHIVAPIIIAAALATLLLFTAREALRPATTVDVVPALFDQQTTPPVAPDAPASRQDDAAAAAPVGRHAARGARAGGRVQAPGWIEAEPYYVAATALADGVVDEILVLEGDPVEKGEPVARLIDEDARLALARADAELKQANAEVARADAELAAARVDWENPVEHDRAVETARAALAETEAELAQLPALIDAERAMLERMREERKRGEQALRSAAATDIEVVILRKDVARQEATLRAAQQRENILRARRDRLAAELRAAERAAELRVKERQTLDAAEAALDAADARRAAARARRDEAELRLERMTIRSPIDGVVQKRLKIPGDKVMLAMDDRDSAHLLHIYDPSRIQVRVDVPLADVAKVFVGQRCEVVVDVLPDATFDGKVLRMTHEADLQKNTLEVKVGVLNPSPLLRPEMLTRVTFLPEDDTPPRSRSQTPPNARPAARAAHTQPPAQAVAVAPAAGVRDDAEGHARLWIVRDRRGDTGRVAPARVEVLSRDGDWARVRGPLSPGDLIVVSDAPLAPGDRVRMRAAEPADGGSS